MRQKPIVPWIGGKTRLAKYILPLFSPHTCYVEPFCGAAGIFFAKAPVKVEVLNDINGELVNLYRVVQHHLEEFVRQFKWALTSREIFRWHQMTNTEPLTDIQRAARFFYLQKNAFGGLVEGQSFGTATTAPPPINLLRLEEELSQAHLRLSGVYIEHLPWLECVERYDREHTQFFCDPPYWGTEGYGVEFAFDQYARLAEAARNIKGKMVITVNDCPKMREAFDGLPMDAVGIKYTSSNARTAERTLTRELVVRSFKDAGGGVLPLFE